MTSKHRSIKRRRVAAIGDCHFPWACKKTLLAVYKRLREFKPHIIIQLGDLYDLFSFTRFPRTHNLYTPRQELDLGQKDAALFWGSVAHACPRARRIQLWGNHDDRAVKCILSKAPEYEHIVAQHMQTLMRFPGVETVQDSGLVYFIDDVGYHHGYLLRGGAHAESFKHNIVVGHTHRGGVWPVMTEASQLWELNAGYVGDRFAKPLSFAAQRTFSRYTLGLGEIDEAGPRFVPLPQPGRGP